MKYVLVARKTILKLTKELPIKQKRVLMLHYGLEDGVSHSFTDIGSLLHCSKQNVQKLEVNALKNLLSRVQELDYDIYDIDMLKKSFVYYDRKKLFLCSILDCSYDELMQLMKTLNDQTQYYPILFKVYGPNLDEEQDLDNLTYPERCLYFRAFNMLKKNYQKLFIENKAPQAFYVNHTLKEIIGCTDEQLNTLIKYIRLNTSVYAIMQKAFGEDFKEKFKKANLSDSEYTIFRECVLRLKEHYKYLFVKRQMRNHICYHNKKLFEILGCNPEDITDLNKYLNEKDYLLMQQAFGQNLDEEYQKNNISKGKRGNLTPIVAHLFNKYHEDMPLNNIEINEDIRKNLIFNMFLNFLPNTYALIITSYLKKGDTNYLTIKYNVNVLEINRIIANYLTWFNEILTSYENIFGLPMPKKIEEQLVNFNFSSWENILLWFLPDDIKKIMASYNNREEILWDNDSLDKITKALTWFWMVQEAFKNIYQNEIPIRKENEFLLKLAKR